MLLFCRNCLACWQFRISFHFLFCSWTDHWHIASSGQTGNELRIGSPATWAITAQVWPFPWHSRFADSCQRLPNILLITCKSNSIEVSTPCETAINSSAVFSILRARFRSSSSSISSSRCCKGNSRSIDRDYWRLVIDHDACTHAVSRVNTGRCERCAHCKIPRYRNTAVL